MGKDLKSAELWFTIERERIYPYRFNSLSILSDIVTRAIRSSKESVTYDSSNREPTQNVL